MQTQIVGLIKTKCSERRSFFSFKSIIFPIKIQFLYVNSTIVSIGSYIIFFNKQYVFKRQAYINFLIIILECLTSQTPNLSFCTLLKQLKHSLTQSHCGFDFALNFNLVCFQESKQEMIVLCWCFNSCYEIFFLGWRGRQRGSTRSEEAGDKKLEGKPEDEVS